MLGAIAMARNILGVVLAGGESKRFGSPKAFATKDQIPFYQYSLKAIEPFVTSTVIITNPKLQSLFAREDISLKILNDHEQYQGQGPLAGIYTAMDFITADWYMVIPIDVPFIQQWVFELLTKHIDEDIDAIVPVVNKRIQPLLSMFNHTMKKKMKEQLDMDERSMHQLLKDKKVIYVPIEEEKPFTNINWQKDFQ